jgi:hypothetical protein
MSLIFRIWNRFGRTHAGHPIGLRRILEIKFIAEVLCIKLCIMVRFFERFAWIVLCSASTLYVSSDGAPLRDRS